MDTREILLQTGLELFYRLSYEGVGVQEICGSAGVTKPSLYHHFGNKRGLLEAMVQSIAGDLQRGIRDCLPYRGDLPKTISDFTAAVFRFAEKQPMQFRYFLSLRLSPPGSISHEVVEELDRWMADQIQEVFLLAAEDHGNMRGRERLISASFLGMLYAWGILISENRVTITDDFIHQAAHQFSHGIYS